MYSGTLNTMEIKGVWPQWHRHVQAGVARTKSRVGHARHLGLIALAILIEWGLYLGTLTKPRVRREAKYGKTCLSFA